MSRINESLLGVVLCGGLSSRMGRDKGLIRVEGMSSGPMSGEGMTWAARMGLKLAPFGMPVVYSVREEQVAAYSAVLPGACLVVDKLDVGGPLNGLLSVHRQFPGSDLLLLACDMQDVDEGTIGELIRVYREDRAEFYVYYEEEFAQPFCAVYTSGGLERVLTRLGEQRSLKSMIGKGRVRKLPIGRSDAFQNYNSL